MRANLVIGILCLVVNAICFGVPEDSVRSANRDTRRWYSPDFIPIQYAGNIGFVSGGVGFSGRKENYQLGLMYGYAPAFAAGTRVHMLTAKNVFHLYRFNVGRNRLIIPYAGLGVSVEVAGRSFFTLPSNMPKGYYDFPKSIHLIPSAGLKVRHHTQRKLFRAIEFFAEATTADAYLWHKFTSDEVGIQQIVTMALGINLLPQ
jgi:hypothetical protein